MSGIEQAGLIIFGIIALMALAGRGRHRGRRTPPKMHDPNADTWWWANRKWKDRD